VTVLNADDLGRMSSTAAAIRGDHEVEVTLWRDDPDHGEVEVLGQAVRLSYLSSQSIQRKRADAQGEMVTISLLVKGPIDLDIELGDRFRFDGVDYVVDLVRPDRAVQTVAEARAVE
jgi:hypothetical protein